MYLLTFFARYYLSLVLASQYEDPPQAFLCSSAFSKQVSVVYAIGKCAECRRGAVMHGMGTC